MTETDFADLTVHECRSGVGEPRRWVETPEGADPFAVHTYFEGKYDVIETIAAEKLAEEFASYKAAVDIIDSEDVLLGFRTLPDGDDWLIFRNMDNEPVLTGTEFSFASGTAIRCEPRVVMIGDMEVVAEAVEVAIARVLLVERDLLTQPKDKNALAPYEGPRVAPPADFFEKVASWAGPVYAWRYETADDVEHNARVDAAGGPTPTRHYRVIPVAVVVIAGNSELRFATTPKGTLIDGYCTRTTLLYAPTPQA